MRTIPLIRLNGAGIQQLVHDERQKIAKMPYELSVLIALKAQVYFYAVVVMSR